MAPFSPLAARREDRLTLRALLLALDCSVYVALVLACWRTRSLCCREASLAVRRGRPPSVAA